jgi:geranylgeranyl reductase family protein
LSRPDDETADVVVVGAGPAGSTTALHLARAGLRVLLLEKSDFPREKVCGDGLTPRAVRELSLAGVDVDALDWNRNRGLRIHVGKRSYDLDWPTLSDFPPLGFTVRRSVFDQFLATAATEAGVTFLTGVNVAAPLIVKERVVGVTTKDGRTFFAPVVVAADGNASRLALAAGCERLESRPIGVAVRTYFQSPMADSDWISSMLELWDGPPGRSRLLHGYGWSFPMGDGTCNVGLGLPDAHRYRDVNLRDLLARWLAGAPPEWEFTEANQIEPVRSAALPMGINRQPLVKRGLIVVGDAAGLINPFIGEGISYAMESGRIAAEQIIDAQAAGFHTRTADRLIAAYATRLADEWGGYFKLGLTFAKVMSNRRIMQFAAHYGLPIPVVRTFTHRILSHLTDSPAHDAYDRIINALTKVAR